MKSVLVILAVLSVIGGFVGIPESLGGENAIEHWLAPVFEEAHEKMRLHGHLADPAEYLLMVLSVGIAAAGIWLGWKWYAVASPVPARLGERFAGVYRVLLNKWFVDEFYDASVVTPTVRASERLLWKRIDVGVIDWCANGLARLIAWISGTTRRLQTGVAQNYVFVFVLGVVLLLAWILGS
jgi:NADH-quinone oxidoreductase subunit L